MNTPGITKLFEEKRGVMSGFSCLGGNVHITRIPGDEDMLIERTNIENGDLVLASLTREKLTLREVDVGGDLLLYDLNLGSLIIEDIQVGGSLLFNQVNVDKLIIDECAVMEDVNFLQFAAKTLDIRQPIVSLGDIAFDRKFPHIPLIHAQEKFLQDLDVIFGDEAYFGSIIFAGELSPII